MADRLTCTDKPELKPWVRKGEAVQRLYEYENGDAILVVRCKHCTRWKEPWLEGQQCGQCMVGKTAITLPDHFCGYGERRPDD